MTNNSEFKPKIAIIVPVYNVERYVMECLESIRYQTYKNWECFVVDDGSTDSSGALVDAYADRDARFKVFHIQNSGQGGVRNYALSRLSESKQPFDYVAFVDSDDVIDQNMYSLLVKSIQNDHTDLAICGFYDYFRSGKRNTHNSAEREIISSEEYVELVFGLGKWRNHPCSQGMIWKLLIKYEYLDGLRFPVDRGTCEDEPFNITLASKVKSVTLLPDALYGYRQRNGSLVRSRNFNLALLKGREICVQRALNVSPSAHLAALGTYVNTLLALVKDSGSMCYLEQSKFELDESTLEKLVTCGYVKNKNARLMKLMRKQSGLFAIYFKVRKAFHHFRNHFIKQDEIYFP